MTLHQQMSEAMDLLDALVDDNLETVTKQRVVIWKKVVRDMLRHYANQGIPAVAPNPDGLPPYRGG